MARLKRTTGISFCGTLGAALLLSATPASAQVGTQVSPREGTLSIAMGELDFSDAKGRRTVHYQLEINSRGRVTNCRITRESGDEAFDKSVCKQLRKRARFDRADGRLFSGGSRYYNGYFWGDPPGQPLPGQAAQSLTAPRPGEPQPLNFGQLFQHMPSPPPDAERSGELVSVGFTLQLREDGTVESCAVDKTSGNRTFDEDMCSVLTKFALFNMNGSGATSYSGELGVQAKPVAVLPKPEDVWTLKMFIEQDGTVSSCEWDDESHPDVDPMPLCEANSWDQQTIKGTDDALVRGQITYHVPIEHGKLVLAGKCRHEGFEDGESVTKCE